jgi:glucose-6-phosphate isomerase
MLMLVGIGGSSAATLAVYQALRGVTTDNVFLCADTIDELMLTHLRTLFEHELIQGKNPLLCIVTKSGTTSETIMNASVFLEVIKRYKPDTYRNSVIALTDLDSPLYRIAREEQYHCLEIPSAVGGRFSAFTAASLLPLALLSIDIKQLCQGARRVFEEGLHDKSDAALSAMNLSTSYYKGYNVHAIFAFSPDLFMLGNWYKQLIGESLGKSDTLTGEKVEIGIVPTVSIGTTDLHSVAQLYLAGPQMITTSFLYFSDESHNLIVPANELSKILEGVVGRSFTEVKYAILKGTQAAYVMQKRPFDTYSLERTSESIGAFMMTKMLETIFLARLFNIDPFDQPAVELYKKETRTFLSRQRG